LSRSAAARSAGRRPPLLAWLLALPLHRQNRKPRTKKRRSFAGEGRVLATGEVGQRRPWLFEDEERRLRKHKRTCPLFGPCCSSRWRTAPVTTAHRPPPPTHYGLQERRNGWPPLAHTIVVFLIGLCLHFRSRCEDSPPL
jgi:hypothetical protein